MPSGHTQNKCNPNSEAKDRIKVYKHKKQYQATTLKAYSNLNHTLPNTKNNK